ncbi:hypothetical protein M011DRAFT_519344 [Sporormia fimetaria CBS 119925]|uniref:UBR-type domain-containing protein n=1 Tax=Sporormia fimetaria CBS 119925 TaxID=1340428 RepID=A0A6A6VCT7_9PLEO|nr:hypothetical protein M011DRAFT_519344 [Sporormia fimetaria CBS 119925]
MTLSRRPSEASEGSQTAADFIQQQLDLEADAREALPYQFDTCSRPLGALRQNLFSCLTCNPPPSDPAAPYTAAGVCYSCSISCHGGHTLVELFTKRNFACDCGTTRLPDTAPCTLRINAKTGLKGDVTGEEPAEGNRYNKNFRNKFCSCGDEYDPNQEKGTMFQCMGLSTEEEGGCGEDWWHPECVVGMSRDDYKKYVEEHKSRQTIKLKTENANGTATEAESKPVAESNGQPMDINVARPPIVAEGGVDGNDIAAEREEADDDDDEDPLPPSFPDEDDFEHFICYKCVQLHPWIKAYAGSEGFLHPVYHGQGWNNVNDEVAIPAPTDPSNSDSKKRKAADEDEISSPFTAPPVAQIKRQKSEDAATTLTSIPEITTPPSTTCIHPHSTTPPSNHPFSLFLTYDFRSHLCHCPTHFPLLKPHPFLLEEEETYEPPVSEPDDEAPGSIGTGSIYDRGEAAFSNMDRVKAIQGAMAYAHLKDGLKEFLRPFAESGRAVGAEDIKAYFERLRGDERGEVGEKEGGKEGEGEGDGRREQSGY